MALYTFLCDACKTGRDVRLTFSEHDLLKNNIVCECGHKMYQKVCPPHFKMEGSGWAWDNGYSLSQMEVDKNLDQEKRFEGEVYSQQGKDKEKMRQGDV